MQFLNNVLQSPSSAVINLPDTKFITSPSWRSRRKTLHCQGEKSTTENRAASYIIMSNIVRGYRGDIQTCSMAVYISVYRNFH